MEEGRRRSPQALVFLERLQQGLGREAILAVDSTIASFWALRYLPAYQPRSFLFSGIAMLGFALPAAIGAKVACPRRKVAVLAGDGGLMFTLQELAMAVQEGLSIPTVLVNDHRYGMIKRAQKLRYGGVT